MNFIFPHEEGFSIQSIISCLRKLKELEEDSEAGKMTSERQKAYLSLARRWKHESSCDTTIRFLEWQLAEVRCGLTLDDPAKERAIKRIAQVLRPEYELLPDYFIGSALGLKYDDNFDYSPEECSAARATRDNWPIIRDYLQYWYVSDRARLRAMYDAILAWREEPDREEQSALDKACEAVENRDLWGKDMRVAGDNFELVSKRDPKEFL